jgi:hypothetical protein
MQVSSGHTYLGSAAAFAHEGRPAVGEEKGEKLTPSFAPIVDVSENQRPQNQAQNPHASEKQTYEEPTRQQLSKQRKQAASETAQLQNMQQEIKAMSARDREVRAHEQAHRVVGGQHAGPVMLNLERGPDGVHYAVSGEVAINVSAIANDPQASIQKLMQVRRAALAPAEPSAQDLQVAAAASHKMLEAQAQLLAQQSAMQQAERVKKADNESQVDVSNDIQQIHKESITESHARLIDSAPETKQSADNVKEQSMVVQSQDKQAIEAMNQTTARLGDKLNINV